VHSSTEDRSGDTKNSYEEPESVLDQFLKYHMKSVWGDLSAKVWTEPAIRNEMLHEISKEEIRVVDFATSKNLIIKSTMFQHHNIHKYTWTSRDGKTHNQIDRILIHERRLSDIVDVR